MGILIKIETANSIGNVISTHLQGNHRASLIVLINSLIHC